jgi:transcription elongation factor GreA
MDRVYLTEEGHYKLVKELETLKGVKRREIAAAMAHARSLGDLSENAEYDAAKEALSENERRIHELTDKLSRAEIVHDDGIPSDTARLGAKVCLCDLDSDYKVTYLLVGPEESDPVNDKISVVSPVGKALLGKKPGDEVSIEVPAGILRYKVESVE